MMSAVGDKFNSKVANNLVAGFK